MFIGALLIASASFAQADAVPQSVKLVEAFDTAQFKDPPSVLWPAYFWLWNAPLDPEVIKSQLQDMAAHDARSVCVLPMPHGFRPDSTNNNLDPDYLTPEYLQRVKLAVDEAARLNMNWWLYDEGGWPSGQALGKVIDGHPELRRHTVTRERIAPDKPYAVPPDALALIAETTPPNVVMPGSTWTPASADDVACLYRANEGGPVDLLNPDATARFIQLTHEAYASVIADHFGKTVHFTFTDEPGAGMPRPPDNFPWYNGIADDYAKRAGHAMFADFPQFYVEANTSTSREAALARVNLYDAVSQRYADAYFGELRTWDRAHGLASGGHLGGEDEMLGAVKYSFGHLMRQLRHEDLPAVDLIWRQLFPGRENQSNFPIAAASAAHQNGTRFAFTESFCVYGNGLTPAQMKWLIDYQYIRGINLSVFGCFPMSTEDHHMTGERPHFGQMDPLWDHLAGFHGYVARLGYALSVGKPLVRVAVYYPARDIWAYGLSATDAADSFEAIGHALMARQVPFDWIDDDVLSAATLDGTELVAGAMRYNALLVPDVKWMHPESKRVLDAFAAAGGKVGAVKQAPGVDGNVPEAGAIVVGTPAEIARLPESLAVLTGDCSNIRVAGRYAGKALIIALFNEGNGAYGGRLVSVAPNMATFNLMTGEITNAVSNGGEMVVNLAPGDLRVFLLSTQPWDGVRQAVVPGEEIVIPMEDVTAVAGKQIRVGEHNFETVARQFPGTSLPQSGVWKTFLDEDYSGEVEYRFKVRIPDTWKDASIQLASGPIEYAATVTVDEKTAGYLLWEPWCATLPPLAPGAHTISIRVANTLANELTSERVVNAWAQKSGPGWPSPYHKRAIEFEKESRGGGIAGPIRITRMKAQ